MALPRPLLSVRAARPPGELVDALRRRLREPIDDMRSTEEEEEEEEVEVEEETEETEETEEWDDLRIEEEVEVEAEPAEERARSE